MADELDDGVDPGLLAAIIQPPQNAIQDGWLTLSVLKVWTGVDKRHGKTDPGAGVTVAPPRGHEILLAIKVSDTDEDQPAGTMSLDKFRELVLFPLTTMVDRVADEF